MHKKTDNNHAEIRRELRKRGVFVVDLSQVGNGVPDLLAAMPGRVVLLEVKSGPKEKLTPAEVGFFELYPAPCFRVENVEDALDAVFGNG